VARKPITVLVSINVTDWHRDYSGILKGYIDRVQVDTQGAWTCKWVRLAVERHLNDLKRDDWAYEFVPDAGSAICDFVEAMPHIEGQWDGPTIVLHPSQVFELMVLFGWRLKENHDYRRFKQAYTERARKSAKSTLLAACAHYGLTCENEIGPQIVIGATTGDQARKVFRPAKLMASMTPEYREEFDVDPLAHSIHCGVNNGFIQPINAKSSTQDGWNPHWGILDELHAHKDRGLYDVIRSGLGSRKNALLWAITTAGYNMQGVCYEQRQMVEKILEGVIELDHYFGIIYTLDESDDPYDETKWIKANPLIGITPTFESLREYAGEAKNSPQSEGEFKTKCLNLWLNAANRWIAVAAWDACQRNISLGQFEGYSAYIGADLSDRQDISAIALVIEHEDRVFVFGKYYLPEDLVKEKVKSRGAHYGVWAKSGNLTLTPGDFIDHRVIQFDIEQWCERFAVERIVFDQQSGAPVMASNLKDKGHEVILLQKNAGNYTDPAKEFEERVLSKRIHHNGDPIMKWMVSNAVVDRRIDKTILPKKDRAMSPNKIDVVDAIIMPTRS